MVWKDSTELGVGVANASKKGGYEVVVVARYSKAGNMLNRFEENVRPVKAGSTSSCITDKIESIEIKDKDASTKINSGKSSEIKGGSCRKSCILVIFGFPNFNFIDLNNFHNNCLL